jgi:hypothetical protein
MNKKISQLRLLENPTGLEEFPLAYQGVTYKLPLAEIGRLVSAGAIGLDQVDNTSDMNKPLSLATLNALAAKSSVGHTHQASEIAGLTEALQDRAQRIHYHPSSDITDFTQAVDARISVRLQTVEW